MDLLCGECVTLWRISQERRNQVFNFFTWPGSIAEVR